MLAGATMFRIFNRLSGRRRDDRQQVRRRVKRGRLRAEALETRKLLAGDCFHNELIPEDVNDDGMVSALDALTVINLLSRLSQDDGDRFTDVNNDGLRSAGDAVRVINRIGREQMQAGSHGGDGTDLIDTSFIDETRSIDGSGNNVDNPLLGSIEQPLLCVGEADYADGISDPAGEDRPNAREISNALSKADPEGTTNERNLSAFVYAWGQFLDHDIDLTGGPENEASQESFDIEVPAGDPSFDPTGTGEATIPLTRSVFEGDTGTSVDNPRQQINEITAWVDGSQVYGSDQEVADSLREFVGGRLLITQHGLLPTDDEGNLLAGDVRAAENVGLTAMHALFGREHNRLANQIAAANPELTDEEVYQQTRAVIVAEMQSITYNEYLPALLGEDALSQYQGYDSTVDPTIANEFSTAAFRFGHSTLLDDIEFIGNDGTAVGDAISLAEAFFNPALLEETGIDPILKFDASTVSQEIDLEVVDSLRDFLFGQPGAGGLDLVALNIQRGRDHGLDDYNSTREAYGLETYESFDQLTSNAELQENLESLYSDINNIDLWVGLMAEDHIAGASVGELTATIISDQFERLRDGDRFFYENVFTGSDLQQLQQTTLADLIQRNTEVEGLQANVFAFEAEVSGTVREANGVAGITVELFDDQGTLVDSTVTDPNGNYRIENIDQTGQYVVQIATRESLQIIGNDTVDVLISTGDMQLRGIDFSVRV
jgi:peroxidase